MPFGLLPGSASRLGHGAGAPPPVLAGSEEIGFGRLVPLAHPAPSEPWDPPVPAPSRAVQTVAVSALPVLGRLYRLGPLVVRVRGEAIYTIGMGQALTVLLQHGGALRAVFWCPPPHYAGFPRCADTPCVAVIHGGRTGGDCAIRSHPRGCLPGLARLPLRALPSLCWTSIHLTNRKTAPSHLSSSAYSPSSSSSLSLPSPSGVPCAYSARRRSRR